ncbi:ABC transporter permease [Mesorhizobium sp. YR577]|uniref:ABC transporter permease n=1 Tax=Mesorhizobium sp. YR577 TaxID=1884373 RepID=UPI0008E9770C|nr:ABC transporter permease [Mesorhizobium sp. YR577]SFT59507.1 peptide/nickel transport system permease protein [Mesorhizobium sp. YR577]
MTKILWRILGAVPTLFGVVLATFLLTRVLPGDPAVFFASNPSMTAADIAEVRQTLGLDKSLPMQFLIYLNALGHGDLGQSISTGQAVTTELTNRLPASAELTIFAFLLAAGIAIPLGVLAALRPGSIIDHACRLIATLGVSMPTFVTGLLLVYVFYYLLGVAPEPIGRLDPFLSNPPEVTGFLLIDSLIAGDFETFWAAARQIILPGVTMALFALAPLARMTRASMLGALSSEFVRTAKASGLAWRTVVFSYAFRNAMLPLVTTLGMTFSYMLGANVLVERVFAWPGIGAFALDSLIALDYAPLQGFMLTMAGIFLLVNLITDLTVAVIDPRAGLNNG